MLNKKPIALAIVITISHLAHADLTTGLIAHYPFNGNANDVSGNGNNGTVNGATLTADRFGNANNAYSFDGLDSIIEASDNTMLQPEEITVSAWISTNNPQSYARIVDKYSYTSKEGYTLYFSYNNNTIGFVIWGNDAIDHWINTNTVIENEHWHHVVATYDESVMKIFYDGLLENTSTFNIPIKHSDRYFSIGNGFDGNVFLPFSGSIDNVRVYNRAITVAEVQELYQEGITTAPAVSTDAPSLITATNAILKGTVNPNGADTIVNFDFGATTAYGQNLDATPALIAATATATSVSAAKTGLTCGSTYHYRVTAVNSVGSTKGVDKAFTTSACPRDLIVTNITLNPAKPVAGTAFNAVVTVKNQGTVATPASKLKLWPNLATVPVCTTAASKIADVGAIAVGANVNVTVSGLISNLVGSNTFRDFADGTCIIGETNETNNQRTLSYRIGGRLPDLIITSITLTPATPARNAVFNAAITVKNQGTAISGSSFLDVWTNQATAATCGAVGNAWADVGALAAGASKVINITGLNSGATAGAKTLRAFVDSWCEEVESNEENNQLIKAYTVQ